MDMATYYESLSKPKLEALAKELDTSPAYLYQIARGIRKASAAMAQKLEEATEGIVTVPELRPDWAKLFGLKPRKRKPRRKERARASA
jgi:DNA-binding transcriptional regulator YdaS (Cro superfamily)